MKSKAIGSFWDNYNALPKEIQDLALKQYRLWLNDHRHPSLRFKKVGDYWSARVNDDFRAVGVLDADTIVWFFIGSHAAYEALLRGK